MQNISNKLRNLSNARERDGGAEQACTSAPLQAGDATGVLPEFGRHHDVRRLFGLKRGKLYELTNAGLVRSISLRRQGQKHSVRLWHLASVRDYLLGLLEQQSEGPGPVSQSPSDRIQSGE